METRLHNKVPVSRPMDTAVEAYKAWTMEIAEWLTMEKNKIELTASEWQLHGREYWKEKPVRRSVQRAPSFDG